MGYMKTCTKCGEENIEKAKFCTSCGQALHGWRSQVQSLQKRAKFNSKEILNNLRTRLDNQLDDLLTSFDKKGSITISGITIPEGKRDSIHNALLSFKSRLVVQEETQEDYKKWLEQLPEMIDDQKCIVCFAALDDPQKIIVCRFCSCGGHRDHIVTWVHEKRVCPLCRRTVTTKDFIGFVS